MPLLWEFPPIKAQDRQKQPKQACPPFSGLPGRQVTSPDCSNVWLVAWKQAVLMHPVPFYKVERFSTWNTRSSSKKKVERSGKDAGHSRWPHAAAYAHGTLETIKNFFLKNSGSCSEKKLCGHGPWGRTSCKTVNQAPAYISVLIFKHYCSCYIIHWMKIILDVLFIIFSNIITKTKF